ncbi:L,D-transpeptidase family protein [Nocardioides sp. URHA0020]|uniref:L,D-transpeptidase family protein n=1 Tax=Nocardioides sp. URHA0020 TaxID=1380392 RepID=UPI00048C3A56|nr:L,D-transpeptidase family protein [Nocardioides sp. URHA0020]
MKLRILLAMTLALTTFLVPTSADAAGRKVRLDGVVVSLREGTHQVVTVNRTSGHHARITLWRLEKGHWHKRIRSTDARIGYGGLVAAKRRKQGTGATPLGTFALPWAFGMHRRASTFDLPYRKVRSGDFWVQDNRSRYYNRFRNQSQGGFRWWLGPSNDDASERLTDYRTQYEWSIVIDFNRRQVRHRGSGIFLHVNGSGATAGCVSAPRWFIRSLMTRLDPDSRPLIAIGR